MADTARTLAAIQALLADNTSGAISPQDLRDAVVSVFDNYASIGIGSTPGSTAQTTNATPDTFDKVTGFVVDGPSAGGALDDNAANDRIDVLVDGNFLIFWQVSFTGTNDATFTGRLAVAGSAITLGRWRRKMSNTGDIGSAMCIGLAAASNGDAITAEIASDDASDSFTPVFMQLAAIKVG